MKNGIRLEDLLLMAILPVMTFFTGVGALSAIAWSYRLGNWVVVPLAFLWACGASCIFGYMLKWRDEIILKKKLTDD